MSGTGDDETTNKSNHIQLANNPYIASKTVDEDMSPKHQRLPQSYR